MARCLLGATIGSRGWIAIGLSTADVLLAVDPGAGDLSPVILLPLAAAMFYALAGTITWSRCQEESAGAMAFNLNACLSVVAAFGILLLLLLRSNGSDGFVFSIWPTLELADYGLVALLGGFLAIIATAVAHAYKLAPTPIVGVFDTSYLGFAALWSAIFFADVPNSKEAFGSGLIAFGAILMSRRSVSKEEDAI